MDSTGENATEYIYDDKNNVIGKKLANGSTLSHGLDESGETIAITQSTEEGIENSTKKHYEALREFGPSPIHRPSFLGKILGGDR